MAPNGMVDHGLWTVVEGHLDSKANVLPFASFINFANFAARELALYFRDPTLGNERLTSGFFDPLVRINFVTFSASEEALRRSVAADNTLNRELHKHLESVVKDFTECWSPEMYLAHNQQQWDALHEQLQPEAVKMTYPFSSALEVLEEEAPERLSNMPGPSGFAQQMQQKPQSTSGFAQEVVALSESERQSFVETAVLRVVKELTQNSNVVGGMSLVQAGIDSLAGTELSNRLQQLSGLGNSLSPNLVFEQPTPGAIAAYLVRELVARSAPASAPGSTEKSRSRRPSRASHASRSNRLSSSSIGNRASSSSFSSSRLRAGSLERLSSADSADSLGRAAPSRALLADNSILTPPARLGHSLLHCRTGTNDSMPLFALPGVTGESAPYAQFLCRILSCGIYAVEHEYLHSGDVLSLHADFLADLSDSYALLMLDEMEEQHRTVPKRFNILGPSFGGLLAHQVTLSCRHFGGDPQKLVVIDPPPLPPFTQVYDTAFSSLAPFLEKEALSRAGKPLSGASQAMYEGKVDDEVPVMLVQRLTAMGVKLFTAKGVIELTRVLHVVRHHVDLLEAVTTLAPLEKESVLLVVATDRHAFYQESLGSSVEQSAPHELEEFYAGIDAMSVEGDHFSVVGQCLSNQVPEFTAALHEFLGV